MKHLIVAIISIYTLPLFCAEAAPFFMRINEEQSTSETAHRTYMSQDGRTTVQLIGIAHKALPSFYDAVEELVRDKVTLYELAGGGLDETPKMLERIEGLGIRYSTIWKIMEAFRNRPDALGRVSQYMLSYKNAKELIHADVGANAAQSLGMTTNMLEMSDSEIRELLDKTVREALVKTDRLPDEGSDLEDFADLLANIQTTNAVDLSHVERDSMAKAIIEDSMLRQNLDVERLKKVFGENYREICLGRNEYLFSALKTLWNRDEVPSQIAIPYGAAHLGFVHDFLVANNYRPLPELDDWLVTVVLGPGHESEKVTTVLAQKEPPALLVVEAPSNGVDEIKKTIMSADNSVKIYLIESSEPTEKAFDDFFLGMAAGNFKGSSQKQQFCNGEMLGSIFSTSNMNYVLSSLVNQGYREVKSEVIKRSDRKQMRMQCNAEYIDSLLADVISKP